MIETTKNSNTPFNYQTYCTAVDILFVLSFFFSKGFGVPFKHYKLCTDKNYPVKALFILFDNGQYLQNTEFIGLLETRSWKTVNGFFTTVGKYWNPLWIFCRHPFVFCISLYPMTRNVWSRKVINPAWKIVVVYLLNLSLDGNINQFVLFPKLSTIDPFFVRWTNIVTCHKKAYFSYHIFC